MSERFTLLATGVIFAHHRSSVSHYIMVSARGSTKPPRVTQEYVSSGDNGKDYEPEKRCSGSVTEWGPKSRAPKETTSEQTGRRVEKDRTNAGKLSKPGG
jgi:hypothetical protein